MAIKLNKTDEGTNVVLDVEGKYSTQVMTDKVLEFCQEMLKDSNEFDSQSREQVFNLIYHYIKNNHRILYSPISNLIYGWFEEYEIEEAEKNLATMLNNLQSVSSYIETEEYKKRIEEVDGDEQEREYFFDTEKAILKIWDHVNLAQQQYRSLKQSEDEYKRRFNKSIEPIEDQIRNSQKDLEFKIKDINAQLLTVVGIFTALAFLLFGGISSLSNILSDTELPVLKVMIIGCVWGLCILNVIFVFLFCVAKMTNLNFKSVQDGSIFRKYPIVWWCNFFILAVLSVVSWMYYVKNVHAGDWFSEFCEKYPQRVTIGGFVIIGFILLILMLILIRVTLYEKHDKERMK